MLYYMHKMFMSFEQIRAKGPDNIAAGPYKGRPMFPRDQLTYNEIPTGTTEEIYWMDCEDEAFAEPEHGLDGAPPRAQVVLAPCVPRLSILEKGRSVEDPVGSVKPGCRGRGRRQWPARFHPTARVQVLAHRPTCAR